FSPNLNAPLDDTLSEALKPAEAPGTTPPPSDEDAGVLADNAPPAQDTGEYSSLALEAERDLESRSEEEYDSDEDKPARRKISRARLDREEDRKQSTEKGRGWFRGFLDRFRGSKDEAPSVDPPSLRDRARRILDSMRGTPEDAAMRLIVLRATQQELESLLA